MMLSWVTYLGVVSLLLALAGRLVEGVVRRAGFPVRWVWITVLAMTLVVPIAVYPFVSSTGSDGQDRVLDRGGAPNGISGGETVSAATADWPRSSSALAPSSTPIQNQRQGEESLRGSTLAVLVSWAGGSTVLAGLLLLGHARLLRRRRQWTWERVEGRELWISENTGPAVVGFLRGEIVLPRWILGAPDSERRVAIAHEGEHIRAGDTRMVFLGLLVWLLQPWNPSILWMLRSLRRAVETDCDARVLALGVEPREYARVLVAMMMRGQPQAMVLAAAPRSISFLERRIRLMLQPRRGFNRLGAMGALALSAALLAGAGLFAPPGQSPVAIVKQSIGAERTTPAARLPVIPRGAAYAGGERLAETHSGMLTEAREVTGNGGEVGADSGTDEAPSADFTQPRSPLANATRAAAPQIPVPDSLAAMRLVEAEHPALLTEPVAGGEAMVFAILDTSGDLVESTARVRGHRIEAGLFRSSVALRGDSIMGMVSVVFRPGPNTIFVSALVLRPAPGAATGPATGSYAPLANRVIEDERLREQVIRPAVALHHPGVHATGARSGEALWFVADADVKVVATGQSPYYGSLRTAHAEIQRMSGRVTISQPQLWIVYDAAGGTIPVFWSMAQ